MLIEHVDASVVIEGPMMTQQQQAGDGSEAKPKQASKAKGGRNQGHDKKNTLRGDIEESGHHVHVCATEDQGDHCVKTTEAIADCVGREHNKAMRSPVKDEIEAPPQEPEEPKRMRRCQPIRWRSTRKN